MKPIHLFFSIANFTYSSTDRKALRKSLAHSLRIPLLQVKTLEWRDEFAGYNLIARYGRTEKLSQFNDEEKEEILYNLLPEPRVANRNVKLKKRAESKRKLKDAIESELKRGNHDAADLMKRWLEVRDDQAIPPSWWRNLRDKPPTMARLKQRMAMLTEYFDLHNELCSAEPRSNQAYLQEVVLKIPHRWKVETSNVPLEQYSKMVMAFYEEYFSDFEIPLVLTHHDERLLNVDTGAHCHVYVSTLNKKTKCRDLLKQQRIATASFQRSFGPVHSTEMLPLDGKLQGWQLSISQYEFNRMFYSFVNHRFLNNLGLQAEFAHEEERRSEQRRIMNIQSTLPKSQRSFNLETMVQEEIKKERLNLAKMQALLSSTEKQLEESRDALLMVQMKHAEELVRFDIETKQRNDKLSFLDTEINAKAQELTQVKAALVLMRSQLAEVTAKVRTTIVALVEASFMRLVMKANKRPALVEKFTSMFLDNLNENLPGFLQPLALSAQSLMTSEKAEKVFRASISENELS
ncbi:hypothetical protein L1D54_16420 [Vibrio brasiliensis]|uniref:hypothetical protein n=1 Tax=Vibrio brasiliensis TaxID=170652 RepID=UPI001EFE9576|nr:hypothetical protein [Vibrio brasiliensis]MCG9752063.1 hypothetical protein [Vibrio brasiliensis]